MESRVLEAFVTSPHFLVVTKWCKISLCGVLFLFIEKKCVSLQRQLMKCYDASFVKYWSISMDGCVSLTNMFSGEEDICADK